MTTQESHTFRREVQDVAGFRRQPVPMWAAALSIVAAVALAGTAWRFVNPGPAMEPPPDQEVSLAASERTPTPTGLPTELPPPPSAALTTPVEETAPVTPAPEQPETTLPLPTVTPTPKTLDIPPRDVRIAGVTTLRLSLSGREFESTGRPLRFAIDPRTHAVDGGALGFTDAWCMQLGLANLLFDLQLDLNPQSEELAVLGQIDLRADFCDTPGAVLDSVDVKLVAPSGSAARIAYNLRGERALFGETNLLNTGVGVIVELEVTNSRPR